MIVSTSLLYLQKLISHCNYVLNKHVGFCSFFSFFLGDRIVQLLYFSDLFLLFMCLFCLYSMKHVFFLLAVLTTFVIFCFFFPSLHQGTGCQCDCPVAVSSGEDLAFLASAQKKTK